MAKQRGLGKGLEALFADNDSGDVRSSDVLRMTEIVPNKEQPRKQFDDEALIQLADSIREHGVIQPILVRPLTNGTYQLVAGERRWRAARMAGLSEIPVIIRELSEQETMEIALIENLQRENLNPIEEALGYQELMNRFSFTQDQVAQRVGKSRSAVANALRLTGLPDKVLEYVRDGKLSAGHARTLLSFDSEEKMAEMAEAVIKKGLSVRELEKYSKADKSNGKSVKNPSPAFSNSYYQEMELALNASLHKKVKIVESDKGDGGFLQIEFYSKEELKELAELLTRNEK